MAIGTSLFLIAVGAILAFAVEASVSGVDIRLIGGILMAVGVGGLLLSLMLGSWGGSVIRRRTDEVVVDDAPPGRPPAY